MKHNITKIHYYKTHYIHMSKLKKKKLNCKKKFLIGIKEIEENKSHDGIYF